MCYIAFLATPMPLQVDQWKEPGVFTIHELTDTEILEAIRTKMDHPYIYEVGAYEGCACGFSYDPDLFDALDDEPKLPEIDYEEIKQTNEIKVKSIRTLLHLLTTLCQQHEVEFYACWMEEWNQPIKEEITLDPRNVDLREQYFGLVEHRKIWFEQTAIQFLASGIT